DANGVTLSSVAQFRPGLPFSLTLRDGTVAARAEDDGAARDTAHHPTPRRH
ncbi:MAG: hypothetical protein IRY91_11280, partial [Gemmatimonadaceae bacterium]|nr:hypothetical protein [Gemmatimonadaceae bacterium]